MIVEEAVSEIRKGDFLLKMDGETEPFQIMPHAPTQHIDGKVISILDGVHEAGQFQTVTLNKGSADGLDKGTLLSIYKRDRQVKVDLEEGKKGRKNIVKYVSIPAEETALAMVYRTGEHLSSAIILENLTSINIGDTVSEPGRDLDNMSDDKPHVRNEPQDSHDTEHNQYNIHSNINKY